ncbi:GNAT family acetyltransferase [Croceicoccus sp. BE223]|uniref:GNAT family acetyltransferase n=1 Tax=Croceicoccus sp. BE223 TaxID=2817716 RepID=UPI00285A8BD1|nr:GNAT family acetyltransferase [Croceicoccus sp. BE223]MDR7103138.1 ribosomal protein S18 acetylase RimI-like enzyme [Croceicoccus sp. BE223]
MPRTLVRVYRDADFEQVERLWRKVFPADPPRNHAANSIPRKLAHQPELFLVAEREGAVVGTTMAGYDGHRGWLYSVAVARRFRGEGVGQMLVHAAEERLRALGCIKINLQIRNGNEAVAGFYRRLGYDEDRVISMGKLL